MNSVSLSLSLWLSPSEAYFEDGPRARPAKEKGIDEGNFAKPRWHLLAEPQQPWSVTQNPSPRIQKLCKRELPQNTQSEIPENDQSKIQGNCES